MLATTDTHGCLGTSDEINDDVSLSGGLTRLATELATQRAEAANVLLLDNGDFLQGAPICDLTALGALGPNTPHPIIALMNQLSFDVAALGNHEFDYGLTFLNKTLAEAEFPVICSNAEMPAQAWQRDICLTRTFVDQDGASHDVTIGLLALVPPQISERCRTARGDVLSFDSFKGAAKASIERLQRQGADLVIALCHAGPVPFHSGSNRDSDATELDEIAGLDALICGHTHQVSPSSGDKQTYSAPDAHRQRPMVQPGSHGRFLGVMDLVLEKPDSSWRIHTATCENLEITQDTEEHAETKGLVTPWLLRSQEALDNIIGNVPLPISTHFATLHFDYASRVAALAKLHAAKRLITDPALKSLPMIATASAFKGGQDGPSWYGRMPQGPVTLRQVIDIYPYHNALAGFVVTGAEILDWLDISASGFCQIQPDQTDQALWNPSFVAYEFDNIFGLTYEIDLSRPSGFTPKRDPIEGISQNRIRNLCLDGQTLSPDQQLILITNSFRAGGGGGFPHRRADNQISLDYCVVRSEIMSLLSAGIPMSDLLAPRWTFSKIAGASVKIQTAPDAAQFITDDIRDQLTLLEETPDGYFSYRFQLS